MPIPAPHVFGVVVHGDFDAEHSTAQNMKSSIPLVFPAPCGCTVWTNEPVAFSREWLQSLHQAAHVLQLPVYRLPVSFAGANGGMSGLPRTCSSQPSSKSEALTGWRGTIAFA